MGDPGTRWRDRHGDVWTCADDGLMHTPETAPFPREYVERKWGPLTPISADDEFMLAVKELATAAMAYGIGLAAEGGDRLRAAIVNADQGASLGESIAPFVESLLTLRPRLVDQLRGDTHG